MKNITLSQLEEVKVKETKQKFTPKWLGLGGRKPTGEIKVYEKNVSVYDKNGKQTYYEDSDGFWKKREYNKNNEEIYFENSGGYWGKTTYKDGKQTYLGNAKGYWERTKYKNGKEIYHEDSDGYWRRTEYKDGKEIEYKSGKYYINGVLHKLKDK